MYWLVDLAATCIHFYYMRHVDCIRSLVKIVLFRQICSLVNQLRLTKSCLYLDYKYNVFYTKICYVACTVLLTVVETNRLFVFFVFVFGAKNK